MWGEPKSLWKAWKVGHLGDQVDPERSTGPWSGHRDFSYDLIRWRSPERIVELGTHYGVSFFSFCQAVADSGINAELHAVDTWRGDEHAGYYDESVFQRFNESLEAFPGVNCELHRSTFAEALGDFEDGSIDLIHIDGFHSYEALKEDYESWLPKLADNGVMLLHDVSQESGYGSARYYAEEIADLVPGFAFPHNFGLAVVFPKGIEGWEELVSEGFVGWRQYYPERAAAQLLREVERDQTRMIDERSELLAEYESRLISDEKMLERNRSEIEAREMALRKSSRQLRQARDRVQQLTPLETSPKAQLKALRRSLPRALGARARRGLRASTRAAKNRISSRSDGDDSPQAAPSNEVEFVSRESLDQILTAVYLGRPAEERAEAERRLFTGQSVGSPNLKRLKDEEHEAPRATPRPFVASLKDGAADRSGSPATLLEGVEADLITVDIWDTLILRNRPADAAKTATGRRIGMLSSRLAEGTRIDPFAVASIRVEVEAELAASTPSEEYELSEVIEGTLRRVGHPATEETAELARSLAEGEAADEIRWSYPNAAIIDLIKDAAQPVALLSDFYMSGDLLSRVVKEVTELTEPLFVSVDMGLSKRLGGEAFGVVRAEYGTRPERHLHVGDNQHSDVEQQIKGGGLALQVPRPDRFPAPGEFNRDNLDECWVELDRQIIDRLPETDDCFVLAGRALAPLAVGLVDLAVEQAVSAGVDRVHYLSREGAFLKEVHEVSEPLLRPGNLAEIAPIHLEVSRLATFAASLEEPVRHSLHRMWSMYANQSVAAMLTSIGIDPAAVGDHLAEAGLTADTQLSDASTDPRIRDLFDMPDFARLVTDHIGESRSLLRDYVTGQTDLTDPFVVVDIGWRGTIQDNLVRALEVDNSIGVYFGLFPFLNAQAPGTSKVALTFDGNRGDEYGFAEPPAVLERPWTADIPSTIGYQRGGDGVRPIRVREPGAVSEGISAFQRGTIEAAPIVAEWIAGMGLCAELLRPGLMARTRRLWADPPSAVADIWFESDHDDTFGALNQVAFHKLGPSRSWLQGELRRHIRDGEKKSGWPAGYRAWTPISSVIDLANRDRNNGEF